jgi:predicted amidophosphoribosyltransferase
VLSALVAGLAGLVLPGGCAGCQRDSGRPQRFGVCDGCVGSLAALHPHPTLPDPAPAGMPPCTALGDYDGVLRELILAYKDRGRYRLARPLGRLLAEAVASTVDGPVLLVPIPDTPAAARARYGDHLRRLARHAALRLRVAGLPASVAPALRARPRPDSTGLDAVARAAQAQAALRPRPLRLAGLRQRVARTGEPLILLDDVVTTGATLAAAAAQLAAAGTPVAGAAVLAATRRTHPPTR